MKILKTILKTFLALIVIFVVSFAGLIVYALLTDYKPGEKVTVFEKSSSPALCDTAQFTFLTWNIGYCGLDEKMDFFYDGGTKVATPENTCRENLSSVVSFLNRNDSADFIFIQEIDRKSKRTYRIDEYDTLSNRLKGFKGFFGMNYDVFFVPLPPSSPMGKVVSGLATFSKDEPLSSVRYSFPGVYAFPKQLFMLDRCFLVNRYPLQGGRELVVINTHNEAFDKGDIRKAQMAYLKTFIENEYGKGNYVITGGDWNQTPPGFRTSFPSNIADTTSMAIPVDFMPQGWKWVFDNTEPSERSVVAAYDQGKTPTTVIDFFLLSPNVEAESVRCLNLGFRNSDHNPVLMSIRLKKSAE